ncbi:MAG: lipoate--protein ligase [Bacteroidales bacterium]|nr:lipoate--protein ligase [Bacteroidales bacterium]
MICIERTQNNPYFNIAAEEYALKAFDQDIFMLWINEPSIIIGKHQNALAEINHRFVTENKIPVIRRISGGGTVFHDLGNLNFTFIKSGEKGKLVDFEKYTAPIVKILNDLGINARFEGKNGLQVNGLKISGNAEHVFRNRVLHHGTLLFDSHLADLNEAIKAKQGQYIDKAVKSNRSIVTNIKEHLSDDYQSMSTIDFKNLIEQRLSEMYPKVDKITFSNEDIQAINTLVEQKYDTWKWNYAYSPKFKISHELLMNETKYQLEFAIKNGIIENVEKLEGTNTIDWSELSGLQYRSDVIISKLVHLSRMSDLEREMVLQIMF